MEREEGGCIDFYKVGLLVAVSNNGAIVAQKAIAPPKFDRINLRISGICWVLGTLGRCNNEASLPFTVEFAATSLAFFLLTLVDAGGFDDPSAGLEGFEEESRLW